jgi:chemotaxis protein CheX
MTAVAAPAESPAVRSGINPSLIVPFVNSVREVFKTMVSVDVTVSRPHVKNQPEPSYDVSAIVQFGGDVAGSVVMSFEREAGVKIVEAFAGFVLDPGSEDFADAVGELCNMVAGSAKKNLTHEASIGLPSVIIGMGHHIARLKDVPCVVIPCESDVGLFAVEVSMKTVTD